MKYISNKILSWKMRQLEEEAAELEDILSDVENHALQFNSGQYPNNKTIVSNDPFCSCRTLADFYEVSIMEPFLINADAFKTVARDPEHHLYQPLKKHLLFEYRYAIIEDTLAEDISGFDYLCLFSIFCKDIIKKRLKNVRKNIRYLGKNLKEISFDRRASHRHIVKTLFKNMDDEHSELNNTTEYNQLNYLTLFIHYGTRKSPEIKAGFIRTGLAG